MDPRNTARPSIMTATTAMDQPEDLLAEVDEPPDEKQPSTTTCAPPNLHSLTSFTKADPRMYERRESLLTRQLHSETEQTDEEDFSRAPPRTLSTQSTWSNPSVASTAELTSDDGHSVASPAISPPLPPTHVMSSIPITEKALNKEPNIVDQQHEKPALVGSEKTVEAGLGRKRCISFACGGRKDERPPTSQPMEASKPSKPAEPLASSASPPKRKCTLKFVCPTRSATESRPPLERTTSGRRFASPPPPERRPTKSELHTHRGSDSTVTHASPTSLRKSPFVVETATTPIATTSSTAHQRKVSDDDSDASTEALRFHEFASSDDEPEEWVRESTCHRSRLTVSDTLKKETYIRKACEEVEEEVVEEEEEEDEDELDEEEFNENDEDDDLEAEDEEDEAEEEESDDGFRTDDEDGFAESDSEGEESEDDWWSPRAAASTAATSMDRLDLVAHANNDGTALSSSVGSATSSHISPRTLLKKKAHRKNHAHGVPIQPSTEPVDLPDSTDFVCGTLDEDKPIEQAFINHRKQREAAKHKARPQDIDPTFPTSDPEMDEEDDEDLVDPEESDHESLMHGKLDDLDGESTLRRRPSHGARNKTIVHRSPPPPARHRSPAPSAPKRVPTNARSPPPPPTRRSTARSPPPRKLFGHSPKRSRSPAPLNMMTSPPNTRRASPTFHAGFTANVLASRPQLTHTSSLPRGGGFYLGKPNGFRIDNEEDIEPADHAHTGDYHKRGAIDIYKGLEKKRQRRKEKMLQKACAKAAAKGEKNYRVKPGKGAERMRELGLELQRYRGKGEHILSM
ncbi:hypothetical protein AC579_3160 [Pseudocercospora musae]|uniref:Extensin domain-containing protein n=1 Tax=Pseudocercospora musae TaxID=113226 RepID=A0A139IEE3_9PEZI|nr:hypothetical protein AC579_3160 [Pseudocercospora musae]